MTRWIRKTHQDDQGAISVLVLLTIWCLVALLAMLWNNAEYGMRRQQAQNAADSAAHDSALWMSRTLNAVAGQNMAICRDASAEAIWRAAISTGGDPMQPNYPNSGSLYGKLQRELTDAQQGRSRIAGMQRRLQALCTRIESEYELTHTALQTLSSSVAGNFPDKQSQKDYVTKLRQADSALGWVENTYVIGSAPTAGRPGPPGPGGEGLYPLVDKWNISPATEQKIYDLIINYINTIEMPIVRNFQTKTYPATSQPLDQIMQQHEATIFQQQLSERDHTPDTISQQAHHVEDFYNATITLATTKQQSDEPTVTDGVAGDAQAGGTPLGLADSGTASAPVITPAEADGTVGIQHVDTIRTAYPLEALQANLPLSFDIDPINPQTGEHDGLNGQHWEDATIWHPNVVIPFGKGSFSILCNVPGGWGHLWLMPIEQEVHTRVSHDQAGLRQDYMVQLDKERNNNPGRPDLRRQILTMQNLPTDPTIAPLPATIVDDTQNAQGGFDALRVLPRLQNPPNAKAAFNSEVMIYNTYSGTYIGDVRRLRNLLNLYVTAYEEFYSPFAVWQWGNAVIGAQMTVMAGNWRADPPIRGLAQNGYFMTLATYKLRTLPAWAIAGMQQSIQEQVAAHIVEMNIFPMVQQLAGGATGTAIRVPTDNAMAILQPVAESAAEEIAAEWVSRPWPYEIAPPGADTGERPLTVPVGIPAADRRNFFSLIALATDNQSPRLLLPRIFGTGNPITAYAQSETFNWMEFNPTYGGNEQFDNPSALPYGAIDRSGHIFGAIGCPRGWRLSTRGGWNWQPRLSVSDALPQAVQLNSALQTALQQAGITSTDGDSFNAINLH